ncbi:MAG: zinc-ribbon domain containing protein [Desulfobacterales bacterium]|nr:zinc-ribbon domain containing protein [Desulfobacterales bacterium]
MEEKVLICIQCNNPFVFSLEEQNEFYAKGFDEPRRCPACRKNKSRSCGSGTSHKHCDKKKFFRKKYDE